MGKYRNVGAWLAIALAGLSAPVSSSAEGLWEGTRASGRTVARELDLSGFDRVEVSHDFEADVRQGDGYRVTVEIDEAFAPHLQVRKAGSTLSVGLARPWDTRGHRPRLHVTLPALTGLDLSGAVAANVSGFRSDRPLRIRLSGASSITGDMEAADVEVRLSGASRAALKGAGAKTRLEASGASEIDFSGFATRDTTADLSGASTAIVRPDGRLDVKASGACRLIYTGSPVLGRIFLSGTSTVSAR